MSGGFDAHRFERLRDARGLQLGRALRTLAETESTNDDALAWARAGAPDGALVIAGAQRRGRGRHGNRWLSPAGENLTGSLVIRPKLFAADAPPVTLAVGLAVRDAVAARITSPVQLKWPNDVWVLGEKIAGILVESVVSGREVQALIVGVGLNVETRDFPPELRATSLARLGATDRAQEALWVDLLAALEQRLLEHERGGCAAIVSQLGAHDALYGKRVRVDGVAGVAAGIAADGGLMIETGTGRATVHGGHVELLEARPTSSLS